MCKGATLTRSFIVFLGLATSMILVTGANPRQTAGDTPRPAIQRSDLLAYDGETISTVELAGRPDLNPDEFNPLIAQRSGEPFSSAKIEQTVAALKRTGKFQDVQVDLRPEPEGVRVMFVLQPAVYFGMYHFTGAERFSYSRLLQVTNYSSQEPYSPVDLQKAVAALETFLRRNGYFEARVETSVQTDEVNRLANVNFNVTLNRLAKFGEVIITGTSPEHAEHLKDILHSLRARMRMAAIRNGKKYSLNTLQNATQYLEGRLAKEHHLAARVMWHLPK